MDVVRVEALSKRYGAMTVLDRVSFGVREGSISGLLGVNGAGKTTLIKILMNIVPPSHGRAEVLGHDSRQLSAADFTRIGYVSENQELPGEMTVGGLLRFLRPFYPTWDDALAQRMLRDFQLPADRKIRQLSHGNRMKARLVSTLAARPPLLILDEPFTGLDPLVRHELIEGVLANTQGATTLVSSHDLAELETFATDILFLDRGCLLVSETLAALQARFRAVTVGTGDVRALPDSWLAVQWGDARVHLVDPQFDPERSPRQIRDVFGESVPVEIEPMDLTGIFLALARHPVH